jgi:DHA2 family multidrug resistance protein
MQIQNQAPPSPWIAFIFLVLGQFMAILDIQIVASSLLNIQAGISASTDDMAWVQSAYLIAEVVAIPMSGFLSRLLSTRVMFLISAGGFTVMSLAAAFAWNIESMIIFRFLQGLFGGTLIPTTTGALYLLFPKAKQMGAQVIVGLVSTMAPVIGPTLGGYLTDLFSWHWLFLINIVPGMLICFGVAKFVHIDKPDYSLVSKIDYLGITAMAVFLGGLEYCLEEGPRHAWFEEHAILYSAIASAIGAVIFFYRAFTAEVPVVDLGSFKDKNFALASMFSFVLGIALYGSNFAMPLYLGQIRGYSSLQIGELMAVSGIVMFFAAPVIGKASSALPKKYVVLAGLLLLASSCFLSGHMDTQWGFKEMLLPQLLRGSGLVCCFIPLSALALGTVAPSHIKSAASLFNLMRNLGGAFGLAYLNTLLSTRQQFHWQQLIRDISVSRSEVTQTLGQSSDQFGALGLGNPMASAIQSIAARVHEQALVLTYDDLFMTIAILSAITLLIIPFLTESKAAVEADVH